MTPRSVELEFGDKANVLQYLGQHYKNPADAIKEYVSNALDEWNSLRAHDPDLGPCEVRYFLSGSNACIEYDMPGMTEKEFEHALKTVAKSAKAGSRTPQIGEKGIGLLAFNHFASKCTIFSRKDDKSPTIKVTLRRGSAEAEFDKPQNREKLPASGMRIVIDGFESNLTRPNGPLSLQRLSKSIASKFDWYIRDGKLIVRISQGGDTHMVKAPDITLPRLAKGVRELQVGGAGHKRIQVKFWYDPSGKSVVSIRHKGVVVLESVGDDDWFSDTVFAAGHVLGYIDADFLRPLPSRTNFEQNNDWYKLLETLEPIEEMLADEIEGLQLEQLEETKRKVVTTALDVAREILDEEAFKDLQMLSGLVRKREEKKQERRKKMSEEGKLTGERSREEGTRRGPGLRISYVEQMFPEGTSPHSKFVAGTVYANTLNEDFKREVKNGTAESQCEYISLLIGKETMSANDGTGFANDFLERMLSYMFSVKRRLGSSGTLMGKRKPGRRTRAISELNE
jgi:hypothetical protein